MAARLVAADSSRSTLVSSSSPTRYRTPSRCRKRTRNGNSRYSENSTLMVHSTADHGPNDAIGSGGVACNVKYWNTPESEYAPENVYMPTTTTTTYIGTTRSTRFFMNPP